MTAARRPSGPGGMTLGPPVDVAYVRSLPAFPTEVLAFDAVQAARRLLGAVLVSTVDGVVTAGRIVETEAYFGPGDPDSHAAEKTGRTQRNAPMFGPPGTTYVYRIYGMHRCLNVVTDAEGVPSAVLIRALEPWVGSSQMTERRGRSTDLCSGPGRIAQALGIDESFNRHILTDEPLTLRTGQSVPEREVCVTGRVGVSRAATWPLRFFVKGSRSVSRTRVLRGTRSKAFIQALEAHRSEVGTLLEPVSHQPGF